MAQEEVNQKLILKSKSLAHSPPALINNFELGSTTLGGNIFRMLQIKGAHYSMRSKFVKGSFLGGSKLWAAKCRIKKSS